MVIEHVYQRIHSRQCKKHLGLATASSGKTGVSRSGINRIANQTHLCHQHDPGCSFATLMASCIMTMSVSSCVDVRSSVLRPLDTWMGTALSSVIISLWHCVTFSRNSSSSGKRINDVSEGTKAVRLSRVAMLKHLLKWRCGDTQQRYGGRCHVRSRWCGWKKKADEM